MTLEAGTGGKKTATNFNQETFKSRLEPQITTKTSNHYQPLV